MAKNYQLSIIRRFARYAHPFLSWFEQRKIAKYAVIPMDYAPIFIIGAPRTGSTILYQLLTHFLDVLYIDNLTCVFFRDFYHGFRFSRWLYRNKPHHSFHSAEGYTFASGMHAPSECADFWYRWLPREKHYLGADEIRDEKRQEIHDNLLAVINRYQRPLVIKNLNAGQRMALLRQIVPGAKFIFIRRHPLYTAQSIWQTKQKLGLAPHEWWSIMPQNYSQLAGLDAYQQIIQQVFYLERQIFLDRTLFPSEQFITVDYRQLCLEPEIVIQRLASFIGPGVTRRKGSGKIPELPYDETQKIADHDFLRLKEEVEKWDWLNFSISPNI